MRLDSQQNIQKWCSELEKYEVNQWEKTRVKGKNAFPKTYYIGIIMGSILNLIPMNYEKTKDTLTLNIIIDKNIILDKLDSVLIIAVAFFIIFYIYWYYKEYRYKKQLNIINKSNN